MELRNLILSMLFLVLALFAGIHAIGAFTDGGSSPEYEYLDMVPLSDFGQPDAMAGCCEVVDYMGVPYVLMTGVGEIKAVHGARETTYAVGKASFDLFLFTGQSNSLYYTDPQYYGSPSPLPPGVAFYLGTEGVTVDDSRDGRSTPLARPSNISGCGLVDITAPDGSVRVAGSYPAFMYDYWKATGHRILVVNSGIGGNSISSFYSMAGESSRWTVQVLDRTMEVCSGLCDLKPVAVLWSQGEADIRRTVEWYEQRLETVVDRFCDGTYGTAFPHVLSTLPKHHGWESPIVPAQAQMDYAEEDPRFVIASKLPLYLPDDVSGREGDPIHYTQTVYGWMGEAFARSAASAMGSSPGPETLAYCPPVGEVASLPSMATAYGTSGDPVEAPVLWGDIPEEEPRIVSGTVRPPYGYEPARRLGTTATLVAEQGEI